MYTALSAIMAMMLSTIIVFIYVQIKRRNECVRLCRTFPNDIVIRNGQVVATSIQGVLLVNELKAGTPVCNIIKSYVK